MPPTDQEGLQWNPPEVQKFMDALGFENPNQLAADAGTSRSVIHNSFDENWAGTVSLRVIELLNNLYGADFGPLIKRGRNVRKTARSGKKRHTTKSYTRPEKVTGDDTP